jgi:hypothetical protein
MKITNIIDVLNENNIPIGYEFYTPIYGKVFYAGIIMDKILIKNEYNDTVMFTADGRFCPNGEILLFPDKDVRDWYLFSSVDVKRNAKQGDIISIWEDNKPTAILIFDKFKFDRFNKNSFGLNGFAGINFNGEFEPYYPTYYGPKLSFANDEDKSKLFNEITSHGWQWDAKNMKLISVKFDFATFIRENQPAAVIVKNAGEWQVRKLVSLKPNTEHPFVCDDGVEYTFCMPYNDTTYKYVFTDKHTEEIYDIAIIKLD